MLLSQHGPGFLGTVGVAEVALVAQSGGDTACVLGGLWGLVAGSVARVGAAACLLGPGSNTGPAASQGKYSTVSQQHQVNV